MVGLRSRLAVKGRKLFRGITGNKTVKNVLDDAKNNAYDDSGIAQVAAGVDSIKDNLEKRGKFTRAVLGGLRKIILPGGRFTRWIGNMGLKSVAKGLSKMGFPGIAGRLTTFLAKGGILSKFLKLGAGAFLIKKIKDLFSNGKKPVQNINPDTGESQSLDPKGDKIEKEILKKSNSEVFEDIQAKNKSSRLSSQNQVLKTKLDKSKKDRDAEIARVIDANNPQATLDHQNAVAKTSAQVTDIQAEQNSTISEQLELIREAQEKSMTRMQKMQVALNKKIGLLWKSLKDRLSDKANQGKDTFFGWVRKVLGNLWTAVRTFTLLGATALGKLALPKLKEGWNWLSETGSSLWGKITGKDDDPTAVAKGAKEIEKTKDDPSPLGEVVNLASSPLLGLLGAGGLLAGKLFSKKSVADNVTDTVQDAIEDKIEDKVEEKVEEKVKDKVTKKAEQKVAAKATEAAVEKGGSNIFAKGLNWFNGKVAKAAGFVGRGLRKAGKFIRAGWDAAKKGVIRKILGTKIGQKIAKVAVKVIKKVGKGAAKSAAKKIPLVGLLLSLPFAVSKFMDKDYIGAAGELLSGILSCFPGLGSVAALGVDAAMIARDIMNEPEDNSKVEFNDDGQLTTDQTDESDKAQTEAMNKAATKVAKASSTSATPTNTRVVVKTRPVAAVRNTTVTPKKDPDNEAVTKKDFDKAVKSINAYNKINMQLGQVMIGKQVVSNSMATRLVGSNGSLDRMN